MSSGECERQRKRVLSWQTCTHIALKKNTRREDLKIKSDAFPMPGVMVASFFPWLWDHPETSITLLILSGLAMELLLYQWFPSLVLERTFPGVLWFLCSCPPDPATCLLQMSPLDMGVVKEGKGAHQGDYRPRVGNLYYLTTSWISSNYKQLIHLYWIWDMPLILSQRFSFLDCIQVWPRIGKPVRQKYSDTSWYSAACDLI